MTGADAARVAADAALEATVVGSFTRVGYAARRALFDWDAEPAPDLHGRVAVITGATGGLGLATATGLARLGAEVRLVGRDDVKLARAVEELRDDVPGASVAGHRSDFTVLDDVHGLAEELLEQTDRLDVLVHNAGALVHDLRRTGDGIEVTAQVHVVAPFLLTSLLLPLLRATGGARVLTVSSGGMYTQRLDVAALDSPPTPFRGTRVYANAKRAQVVLNTRWPAPAGTDGIAFHALHPGWADTPGLQASLPRFRSLLRPLLRTPAQGADTAVWLASSPAALASTGDFWHDRRRRPTELLPWTRTPASDADALVDWCVARAGAAVAPA
jgi:NAD(P)-dependent dehydrogenase (short-subunit alcohol dehydrogenase family)